MDGEARHKMQCWSNAKDCLVGNCKNTEKSIGNVKRKVFCETLVICYKTRLTEEMTVITTARTNNNDNNNSSSSNNNNNKNNNNNNNNNHHLFIVLSKYTWAVFLFS